jgi:hypothetical protein
VLCDFLRFLEEASRNDFVVHFLSNHLPWTIEKSPRDHPLLLVLYSPYINIGGPSEVDCC